MEHVTLFAIEVLTSMSDTARYLQLIDIAEDYMTLDKGSLGSPARNLPSVYPLFLMC